MNTIKMGQLKTTKELTQREIVGSRQFAKQIAALVFFLLLSTAVKSQTITTIAGGGPNNVPAESANLSSPSDVALDPFGNLYIAVPDARRVFKVDAGTGILTVAAGNGSEGPVLQDGELATSGDLTEVYGIALDAFSNIYILSSGRVLKVDAVTGIASIAAAGFSFSTSVALDSFGNIYVAEPNLNRIRKVDATTGAISIIAGNGSNGYSGDGGPANSALLANPSTVEIDASGNIYIADTGNNRIRKVDAATGIISTIAGNGISGYHGDGGLAIAAELDQPRGLTVDALGNILISDTYNGRIRKVERTTGLISTVAGTVNGYSGDGGSAISARLYFPWGVTTDLSGNIFIADTNNKRVRKVDAATGIISTYAGNGFSRFSGDGRLATSAGMRPEGVAFDSMGNIFIADRYNDRIRKVDLATGIISTFIEVGSPFAVTIDTSNNLYVVTTNDQRILRVDAATHAVTTVAGNGTYGFSGDGGPATHAQLANPFGVAVDASGNIYIADTGNNRIRKVDAATGIISTIAGNGASGYFGDGGPATSASLTLPWNVDLDASRNIYIADRGNGRVRKIDSITGIISTIAENLSSPEDVAVDIDGNIFVAETNGHRIRRINATTGIMTTVAGGGDPIDHLGDGGAPTSARLNYPSGVAVDPLGNVYVVDSKNYRIRHFRMVADGTAPTVTASATKADGTPYLANTWSNQTVTVHFTCSDPGGSGVYSCSADQVFSYDGTTPSSTGTSVDLAGNAGSADFGPIKIDKTAPNISINSPTGATYLLNQTVTVDYECSDEFSAVNDCVGTIEDGEMLDTSMIRSGFFTVNASDFAGNASDQTINYAVGYGIEVLFDQTRAHKAGSTVPIRIRLVDANGVNLSSSQTVVHAVSVVQTGSEAGPVLEDAGNSNPDFDFRYEPGSNSYIFNLKTRGFGTGTYQLNFIAGDGAILYSVEFQVRQ